MTKNDYFLNKLAKELSSKLSFGRAPLRKDIGGLPQADQQIGAILSRQINRWTTI
jgi:hypothetical protein